MNDRDSFIQKIKELKAIIRTPRLYNIYKEQFDKLKILE